MLHFVFVCFVNLYGEKEISDLFKCNLTPVTFVVYAVEQTFVTSTRITLRKQ